ncbi:MAG TPA: hypothetical protein VFQ67_07310 [Allosphingosinicella sp.]|jgi:hypothetical protein|nr:hypothetical protein [Allosphingosinicella sp.]
MAVLAANVPHETDLGFVDVENRLAPGRYRFRLTVFDESKNESEPAFIVVTVNEVQRDPRPDPRGPRVVLDRAVIDRIVLNPDIGDAVRPTRPIFPRRPGG